MGDSTSGSPAQPQDTAPPPSQQGQPLPSGTPGYRTPEDAEQRNKQDQQWDDHWGNAAANAMNQRIADDEAITRAASDGGFHMDVGQMQALLPRWQSIADKLNLLVMRVQDLQFVPQPAMDEASSVQIDAARKHAGAYMESVQDQYTYAKGYVDALKKSIDRTQRQDQSNADGVGGSGRTI
jgi:hypothetical protein